MVTQSKATGNFNVQKCGDWIFYINNKYLNYFNIHIYIYIYRQRLEKSFWEKMIFFKVKTIKYVGKVFFLLNHDYAWWKELYKK